MSDPLKVLFLNNSDSHGGAARAAYRLFAGLREQGVTVKMLVRDKTTTDPDVISCLDFERKGLLGKIDKFSWKIKNRIRKQKWKKYPNRESVFLNDLDSISLLRAIRSIDFDVIHLHFVANRFLDLHELTKIDKPIVWTLHDSWAFTGICHFFYNCKRYEQRCGCCPMLHSDNPTDFTHKIWNEKNRIYQNLSMQVVTPSNWLGTCAAKSGLFRNFPVSVVHNGIDTRFYRPIDKLEARKKLGLDPDKYYLLFGAVNPTSDSNKGYDLLLDALTLLKQTVDKDLELLIVGADEPTDKYDLGFPTKYMGVISTESTMVEIYNAANVVIVPSRSENFSNTILESLACGTPVVGFNIGGNSDLINHKQNGYLASPFDTKELAAGIEWCLVGTELVDFTNEKIEFKFPVTLSVARYKQLYDSVSRTILK